MADRISIAKKILDIVFSSIKKDKKFENVEYRIAHETKKEILDEFKCKEEDLFGIFGKDGKFRFRDKSESGKKIIQQISAMICKEFRKTIITGSCIYYFRRGKIRTKRNKIEKIISRIKEEEDKNIWRITFCRILGYIPKSGIFLIDNERSASVHEEATFHSHERKFGMSVIISGKAIKTCKSNKLAKINVGNTGNIYYFTCPRILNIRDCVFPKSRCFVKKLKINLTSIQPFIEKESHLIIIVDRLMQINKIIKHVLIYNAFK